MLLKYKAFKRTIISSADRSSKSFGIREFVCFKHHELISFIAPASEAYFSLCIIKYFRDIISPHNDMKAKIDALFAEYPAIKHR